MFTPGRSRAVATADGYRVSGRWHTCSGSLHCNWVIGGTTVYDGDVPRHGRGGAPVTRLNFIPRSVAVQREVAAAEATLRAARCYALATLAEVDSRVAAGESTTPAQRADFFMAAHHAGRAAVEVVDTLHRAAGSAGIFESSHLLRCFLDVHVAVAHVSLQPINLGSAGRTLMHRSTG